jgi:hypothetical protein
MTRVRAVVFALLLMSCAAHEPGEAAPSASSIFERYLSGRGGQAAFDGLAVIERQGWISVDTGPETGLLAGAYHTCLRYPDRVAIEISAGPWQVAQALRAAGAVECDPGFAACRPATDAVRDELIDTASHANKDLLDRADAWRAATVTPSADGQAWRLSIDGERWAEFARDDGRLRALGIGARWRRLGQWRAVEAMTFPRRLEDFALQHGESEWRNTVHLRDVRVSAAPSAWCTERFGAD